jgi:hypothetical protein
VAIDGIRGLIGYAVSEFVVAGLCGDGWSEVAMMNFLKWLGGSCYVVV